MNLKKIKVWLLLFVLPFLATAGFALAQTAAQVDVTIPNVPPASNNPGAWVGGFYQFSLMVAGLLAFGMIVYAGLRYTFAAGNPSTQSDARDQILQALLGLLLLLGAFIVLTTINPSLTNLQLPELRKIEGQPGGTQSGPQGQPAPSAVSSPPSGATIPKYGNILGRLSDAQAKNQLGGNGIGIKPDVSFQGMLQATINEVIGLKSNCSCSVYITSGTEGPHSIKTAESHSNGYKFDVQPNDSLDNYIKQKFTPIGPRSPRDPTPQWRAPSGAIYAREGNHWDVLAKP